VDGSCEHGNEYSGYIKFWEIPASRRNWRFSRRAKLYGVRPVVCDKHMF
jgi:predicted RNA-binding protein